MQTVDISKCIEGTFVRELKNRFLCEVLIDGVSTVCYVPSSCRLGNFIELKGKKIFLFPTITKNARTQYSLFAVLNNKQLILLNSSMANDAVGNSLKTRKTSFLGSRKQINKEVFLDGYKADFFIRDTNTIIEVKSVLSLEKQAVFPTVYSERTIKQLNHIKTLMERGYNAHYIIVSLNPSVKTVSFPPQTEFWQYFNECLIQGMNCSAFTCKIKNMHISLDRRIPIESIYL